MRGVETELTEFGLSFSKKLFITLHSPFAIHGDWARQSDESGKLHQADVKEEDNILERHVSEEYASSLTDHKSNKRIKLTSKGIIRALSFFS
jgi:hypothetical protein